MILLASGAPISMSCRERLKRNTRTNRLLKGRLLSFLFSKTYFSFEAFRSAIHSRFLCFYYLCLVLRARCSCLLMYEPFLHLFFRWTQDHQVPASVLHAETLAAGLRVVPVMVPMVPGDGKEEGKQPATYPAGARKKDEEEAFQHHRVVEDLYREGWKDHESAEHATASKDWVTSSVHLAPALDFLLTCFRGQAR